MAVAKSKGITVNQFLIFAFGLMFLLGSVLVFLYILKGVYGRFDIKETLPKTSTVTSLFTNKGAKIAILYSKYTENMLPDGSTWLVDNITTWKKFFDNNNMIYDVISDKDIEFSDLKRFELIVLPGSKSLSDKEIVQLKKYLEQGGSVYATSGTASFSNDGKWRGWQFFSEVFGCKFTREIDRTEITRIHTLRGNLPVTAGIPTGYPLKVATWDHPFSVEVMDPRTIQASFWYNYRLEAGLVREEIQKSAGIVYGTYGAGRFVWMGFEINSVIGVQEDYINFDKLFRNSVHWLTHKPIIFAKDWPENYEAAVIITPTLNEDIYNIRNLFGVLYREEVKATFFVEPSKAEANKDLIRSLTNYGDVAAIADIGYLASVTDTNNKLNDYSLQLSKLQEAKQRLSKVTGKPVTGFLPTYGLFDQNSIQALIDAGYHYILTDSLTDRCVPNTIIKGEKAVISMTKTARDDYEVIRNFGLKEPNFQLYTYEEDLDRVLFEGGLYVMKMHTEYQCKSENVNVIRDLIKKLKAKKYWIATAEQIHDWWMRKNALQLKVEPRGVSRVVVTVSNPGEKKLPYLGVDVNLNDDAKNISISSEIIGTKMPGYVYNPVNRVISLKVKDLEPKESRIYYIDYDKPNS